MEKVNQSGKRQNQNLSANFAADPRPEEIQSVIIAENHNILLKSYIKPSPQLIFRVG